MFNNEISQETNTIETFIGSFGGIEYYVADDGTIYLNLEQVAIGLGFVKVQDQSYRTTSGPIKSVHTEGVRWDRINKYLHDYGCKNYYCKGDFIPENLFYLLAMKAKN